MGETATTQGNPGHYRRRVGAFEVIAVHDGVVSRDRPPGFVRNASEEAVGDALVQAGMPRDKLTITFTPLVVKTPDGLVLIDTGFGESGPPGTGLLVQGLAAAGYQPEDVTMVIISHCHGDHILGLRRADGSKRFAKAQLLVPRAEWEFWMNDETRAAAPEMQKNNFDVVHKILTPERDTVRLYAPGETLLPGLTAVDAAGHSPGMCAIDIVSEGERLLFVADITNTPMLFGRHPEWQAMFDMAPEQATATRRRFLDEAAAEHTDLFFFHAPFPGLATVAKNGEAYEYLPALWR